LTRLVIVLAAALVAVGIYAVTAPAGQQSVSPKRVAALEKRVSKLQSQLNCLKTYAPVSVYGDPNGTAGYVYQNPDTHQGLTTALDATASGETPDADFAVVAKSCISSAKFAAKKLAPSAKPAVH